MKVCPLFYAAANGEEDRNWECLGKRCAWWSSYQFDDKPDAGECILQALKEIAVTIRAG